MSIASVAAQQAAAVTAGAAAATGARSASSGPLGGLSANLNTFLNLLMTQLKNQNPTSPLDTAQFTSQLVQYSSVEQQIQTNSNLTNLIQLTQGSEVVQSSALLGHTADVSSNQLTLQKGQASINFTAAAAGPVGIVVTDASGHQLATTTMDAVAGANSWNWDGGNLAGGTEPDGAYPVTVTQAASDGSATALPTITAGTVTGVKANGQAVTLQLGALSVNFSALQSVQP